jgi:hypothetical protein
MISKKDYLNLKAYWDFQRKIEYNKEQLIGNLKSAEVQFNIEIYDMQEMFDDMWSIIDQDDYVEPPRAWIPKDEKFQIEGELKGKKPK